MTAADTPMPGEDTGALIEAEVERDPATDLDAADEAAAAQPQGRRPTPAQPPDDGGGRA